MALQPGSPAPYAPATSIVTVIDKFRNQTISGPVDQDLLHRLGISESLKKRTMNSLRALEFVDDKGKTTDSFDALVAARPDEYKAQLTEVLQAAYANIFSIIDPATSSPDDIRNAFWGYEPKGQIDNMVRLFLGLCAEAGLVAEKPKVERVTPRKAVGAAKKAGASNGQRDTDRNPLPPPLPPAVDPPPPPGVDPVVMAWVRRMPPTTEAWPDTRKEQWFKALRALVDGIWPTEDASKD